MGIDDSRRAGGGDHRADGGRLLLRRRARPAPMPLPEVIEIAHARGVPVIVDAAAQIPPVSNLWHFTRDLGADLAIFSGGKGLCGRSRPGWCSAAPT